MNRRIGVIIGAVSILVLLALLTFGPGLEKQQPDQIFWKKDFVRIDYVSAGKERNVALRLIRKAGFVKDEFTVEAPGRFEARRGSYNAKNVFSDFGKPRNAGSYAMKPGQDVELGLTPECAEVVLYTAEDAKPLHLRVGKKNQNGNSFATVDVDPYKGQVLLVPAYLFERFEHPIKEFREQRIVIYPTDSYTEELEVATHQGGTEKKYWMRQEKYKNKDGIELPRWRDRAGREIPLNQANMLENSIRDIQIQEYRDAPGVPAAQPLWDKSGADTTIARVKLKGAGEITIRLRTQNAFQQGKDMLAPIQTTVEAGVDFAKASVEKDIADRIDAILEAMQREAAQKDKPSVPAK